MMAALPEELKEEALLRFPPQEPARLVRAALVCKRWHSIISDQGFRRRLREFHGAPPTLAAVHNAVDGDAYVARFAPCCAASFPPRADRRGSAVLDCRHGRVLLRDMPPVGEDLSRAYVSVLYVWDAVTDEQWKVPLQHIKYPYKFYDALVLCAAAGTCDHLDCHGGHFLVVLVGTDLQDIFVYTYSSETRAWSKPSSIHLGTALKSYYMPKPDLVAGATIYTMLDDGRKILKHDLVGHVISVMNPPPLRKVWYLVASKDGGLGVADVEGYNLRVWSWRAAGDDGVEQWVEEQVIDLGTVLSSIATGGPSDKFNVVGFGEGFDIIFVSTNDGIFGVWRKSGRVMKVGERRPVMPRFLMPMFCYQSFYTPAIRPAPCMSVPLRSRSRCGSISNQPEDLSISEEQTEAKTKLARGKKRAGVKEKTERAKKPKQDHTSLHIPAMGTRSKTAHTSGPAMSTRSKTRSRHICMRCSFC